MVSPDTSAPTVITVAYRADDHLERCLTALGTGIDVVVVDNAASSDTRAIAERAGARYVPAARNAGFAAGVNIGLAECPTQGDVLLLNPDARLDADAVRRLQEFLYEPGTHRAAVGPQLVGTDGTPEPASWPVPSPGQVWSDALGLGRFWRGRRFVTGAALLLAGPALAELGGLDEGYFLYAEEADWQLRAMRAGWTVTVADEVTAVHAGGASSNDPAVRERFFHESGRRFARRWYGRSGAFVMVLGSVVAAARRSVVGRPAGRAVNRRALRLHLRALRHGSRAA